MVHLYCSLELIVRINYLHTKSLKVVFGERDWNQNDEEFSIVQIWINYCLKIWFPETTFRQISGNLYRYWLKTVRWDSEIRNSIVGQTILLHQSFITEVYNNATGVPYKMKTTHKNVSSNYSYKKWEHTIKIYGNNILIIWLSGKALYISLNCFTTYRKENKI